MRDIFLKEFLRPEFINRVDEIITFGKLTQTDFQKIAVLRLQELQDAMKEQSLSLRYDDSVASFVAEHSFSEKYGARNMARYLQTQIEDPIAELLVEDRNHEICGIRLCVEEGMLSVIAERNESE